MITEGCESYYMENADLVELEQVTYYNTVNLCNGMPLALTSAFFHSF
jgi:hypothetical protein